MKPVTPTAFLFIIVAAFSLASCALPLPKHEIALGYRAANADRSVSDRAILGLDVRKGSARGMVLGYSRTTLVSDGQPIAASAQITPSYHFPLAVSWQNAAGGQSILGWMLVADQQAKASRPSFVHDCIIGAGLLCNDHHQSAVLGFCDAATLLPALNSVHKLRYSSKRRLHSSLKQIITQEP